ncbi:Bro-N domain-containing protein [Pseudomonas chlororaphis]|nr:BRO family protein [Pseudomonas chlororaphis]
MNKSSRHEKAPSAPTLEADVAERQSSRKNVMTNNSTAVSNVIPFEFRGKGVRAIMLGDEPWFVAADVCKVLKQSNTTKALQSLDDDERSNFKLGRQGMVNIVSESGLYTLILRCDEAVKKGSDAHAFRKWVTAEVLPVIRKTGSYTDSSNKMATLVDDVIGVSGTNLINGVIGQKVAKLPAGIQRQAKHKLHAILHTRFNVPRTELIPAGKLDVACEYLAAYALEGEFLPKDSSQGNGLPGQLSPTQRFLVFTDHAGNQQVQPIPREACVMTHREMISGIVTGDIMVSTPEMFEFLAAVTENLRLRSLSQARRAAA